MNVRSLFSSAAALSLSLHAFLGCAVGGACPAHGTDPSFPRAHADAHRQHPEQFDHSHDDPLRDHHQHDGPRSKGRSNGDDCVFVSTSARVMPVGTTFEPGTAVPRRRECTSAETKPRGTETWLANDRRRPHTDAVRALRATLLLL